MKLTKVKIKNFRSLADITIPFDMNCRILVGINESGKSNVLKALSLLQTNVNPSKADIRVPAPEDPAVTEAYVRFIFHLDSKELGTVLPQLKSSIFNFDPTRELFEDRQKPSNFEDFITTFDILYTVDLLSKSKMFTFWKFNGQQLSGGWNKVSADIPDDLTWPSKSGIEIFLAKYKFVHDDDLSEIPRPPGFFEPAKSEDMYNFLGKAILEKVQNIPPKVLYWVYDDKNLLPSQINSEEFASNPDHCLPLKHMFSLAQISDVRKDLNDAQSISVQAVRNLLNRVSKRTTDHFRSVWKDYPDIKFLLSPNGDSIDISIQDEFNLFGMVQRSDGFKRFVTFLLMISSKVHTDELKNTLLLIDEPDGSLHPAGARYLRDELIKISDKNFVVFSTHSIFMIDTLNVGRHLLLKKNGEKTTIQIASMSNITDEEIIFNALGYSLFENLKKQNILFEGWRDKKLFQTAQRSLPEHYRLLEDAFRSVGICHAQGVKDIRRIAPILELADRNCFILTDSDSPAKQHKKEFEKEKCAGSWITYDELLPTEIAITSEDFIKSSAILRILEDVRLQYSALVQLSDADFAGTRGKLQSIKDWLNKGISAEDERSKVLNNIKENIFSRLVSSDIEDKYYLLLTELAKRF